MNTTLRLQLTSLSLPKTSPEPIKKQETPSSSFWFSEQGIDASRSIYYEIVVSPGEIAQLAIQLENLTHKFIVFSPVIEGEFPKEWYQMLRTDDKLLTFIVFQLTRYKLYRFLFIFLEANNNIMLYPQEKIDIIVQWKIPLYFFEFPDNLPQNERLTLDYTGKITIFYQLSLDHYPVLLFVLFRLIQSRIYPLIFLFIKKFISYRHQNLSFNLYVRPDSLYLTFLPEIYRQIDFMGRFLNLFEQTFEPDVNILDTLWGYFNPMITSEAFLPFLSHWVGGKLTPALSLSQQRYFVRQAIELYKWRGTRHGLRLYLHLYTGLPLDKKLPEAEKHISIEETFGERLTLGQTKIGTQALIGGGQPHHFKVRLTPLASQFIDENLVRQIIEQEKPAFCTYELIVVNSH